MHYYKSNSKKNPVEICNVSSGHWQAETILLERDATSTTTTTTNFVLFSHVVVTGCCPRQCASSILLDFRT